MTANSWVRNPRLSEMPQNAQQWRDFVLELQFTNQDNQSGRYLAVDGNLALPSFAFLDDPDTGIYQLTAGSLGISGNGALIISFTDGSPGSINPKQAFYHIDGTNLAPSYAFLLDANTGM